MLWTLKLHNQKRHFIHNADDVNDLISKTYSFEQCGRMWTQLAIKYQMYYDPDKGAILDADKHPISLHKVIPHIKTLLLAYDE